MTKILRYSGESDEVGLHETSASLLLDIQANVTALIGVLDETNHLWHTKIVVLLELPLTREY